MKKLLVVLFNRIWVYFDMVNEDIILTIGDMELKIPKDGNIQIRTKKGTAILETGFKVQNKESSIELTAPFTTTSGNGGPKSRSILPPQHRTDP